MLAKYRYLQWVFILSLIVSNSFARDWEQITELPTWKIGDAAAAINSKIYLIGDVAAIRAVFLHAQRRKTHNDMETT